MSGAVFDGNRGTSAAEPPRAGGRLRAAGVLPRPGEGRESAPPSEPAAPPEPGGERRSFRQRLYGAASLGVAAGALGPVLYVALPAPILFYVLPLAFAPVLGVWGGERLLNGARRVVVWTARRAWKTVSGALRRVTGRAPEKPPEAPPPVGARVFWRWGVGLGLGGAVLLPLALGGAAAAPLAAHTLALAAAAIGLRLTAGQILRLGAGIARRLGAGLKPPALFALLAASPKARARAFWAGLLAGALLLPAALALSPTLSVTGAAYLALLTFAWAGAVALGGEALRVLADFGRWLAGRLGLGTRVPAGPRPWVYSAVFALGVLSAVLPVWHRGAVVERVWSLTDSAAELVARDEAVLESLPADWRFAVETLAHSDETRVIGPAFAEEAERVLAENPEGRKLLETLRDRGGKTRLPLFFLSGQRYSGAYENPVVHGVFLNTGHVTGRGWTVEEFLADPEKQRALARDLDQLLFHELVHTEQSYRLYLQGPFPVFFPGQFDRFPTQVGSILHRQLEYEAHIRDHLYFHEKLKADVHASGDIGDYEVFLRDLDDFLAGIHGAKVYESFVDVEAERYRRFMEDIRSRWPALSAEGYALLSLRYRDDPFWSAYYAGLAHARAHQYGLPPPRLNATP